MEPKYNAQMKRCSTWSKYKA